MSGGTIVDYASLQTALANFSNRADLTSRLPDFIQLAEAKMNRYLRLIDMTSQNASFSITGEYVATPTSFGGVKTFYINTDPKTPLEFMADDLMTALFDTGTGKPRNYNVQGSNFRFGPVPDSTYTATLVYYLAIPNLTTGATTNWVITSHPDAYLYGGLAELNSYLKDFEAALGYAQAMYKVLDEMKGASALTRWGSGPISVRVDNAP